jgi:hypothetical protein
MKNRGADTISERELVSALANSGRTVALEQLSVWRKDGLLPPLACSGKGNRRSHYWCETDILERACLVRDLLERHGRMDEVLIGLWLKGFQIPLALLRRAWQHRARIRKRPEIRRKGRPIARAAQPQGFCNLLMTLLAQLRATMTEPSAPPAAVFSLLGQALSKMGYDTSGDAMQAHMLFNFLLSTLAILEDSELLRKASEDTFLEARRHLLEASRFLKKSCGGDDAMVEALAPPLFIGLLALLHSGQGMAVETVMTRMTQPDRQIHVLPVRHAAHSVRA